MFEECFEGWIRSVFETTAGQAIAVDGKTVKRSYAKKSNEITAIPELLKILEIKGCIITIDAMVANVT